MAFQNSLRSENWSLGSETLKAKQRRQNFSVDVNKDFHKAAFPLCAI